MRLRVELLGQSVAVLEGDAPVETVCSANTAARREGVRPGMPRADVASLAGIALMKRSENEELSAGRALLNCLGQFVPAVERCDLHAAARCVFDIGGLGRLHSSPLVLCRSIRAALLGCGLHASIAVSGNLATAMALAQGRYGITMVPEGQEAQALAPLLLDVLHLDEAQEETLSLWGIRTLGALAALPLKELIARMGQAAKRLRALARGEHVQLFAPTSPELALQEELELDSPVVEQQALLFLLAPMLDQLLLQCRQRSLALAVLTLTLERGSFVVYEEDDGRRSAATEKSSVRTIRTAVPTLDKRALLKLLQLDLDAKAPGAPVVRIRLAAEAAKAGTTQAGLFAPPLPETSRLDVTLARLQALVGKGRVGSPVLENTHAPDDFRMQRFMLNGRPSQGFVGTSLLGGFPALRCMRPPLPVRVEIDRANFLPCAFWLKGKAFAVESLCGPWKEAGSWWGSEAWAFECWDVVAVAAAPSGCAFTPVQAVHVNMTLYLLQKEAGIQSTRLCCRMHREIDTTTGQAESAWYLWGLYD